MKRLVLIALTLILTFSWADARRKKEYAGAVKDMVYQDSKFDFQIKVNDNWKYNIGDADATARLILIQKKFGIPSDYKDASDYTYIPKMVVWADTSSMSAPTFMDSLLSNNFKSKQKKEIMAEFDILSQSDVIPKGRIMKTMSGETAVVCDWEAKYAKDIATSTSSDAVIHVNRKYHGQIVAMKHAGVLYLFHTMCEDEFREPVAADVNGMLNSIAFAKAAK